MIAIDEHRRSIVEPLLKILATEHRPCKACQTELYFLTTPKGKTLPVQPDGVVHFATCPAAESFRRKA